MSPKAFIFPLLLLVYPFPGASAEPSKWLDQDDESALLAASSRLSAVSTDDPERQLAKDAVEQIDGMLMLRGRALVRKRALERLVQSRNARLISLGLRHQDASFRTPVVDALADLGDKSVVPQVVDALEREASYHVEGSTAEQVAQLDFRRHSLSALARLTGLTLAVEDLKYGQEILKAISAVKAKLEQQSRGTEP